jgi:hypothetical protein
MCSAPRAELLDVINPATQELLGRVPRKPMPSAAQDAPVPPCPAGDRPRRRTGAQYLYRMKSLLEEHGKSYRVDHHGMRQDLDESRGEILRSIENVESPAASPPDAG